MLRLTRLTPVVLVAALLAPASRLAGQAQAPAPQRVLRAGAATSNITPPLGVGIVGNWTTPAATRVHDELHARCLVLDDGTTRVAFAIVDNVSIDRDVFDEAKRQIREATGLAPERVLMAATHTHSGPSARGSNAFDIGQSLDEYQTFLARRIADGVRRAIENLEPARIAWGAVDVPQHVFNRRWLVKPGAKNVSPFGVQEQALMNPGAGNPNIVEPAGPTDPQVSFISVQAANARPIALLANYSLHYVGGVPSTHLSADYFAAFADRMQQLLGADRLDPPFVGIMSNGTSGDVNNINVAAKPGQTQKFQPYGKLRLVASDVAEAVFGVQQKVQHRDWVELKAAQAEQLLQTRRPTPQLVEWAKQVLARPAGSKPNHPREEEYARRTISMATWPAEVSVILQAFRIGDLAIATIPFETFAEIGLELKARSPIKPMFTIELANGAYGYLPSPRQHALGGYETWLGTNRVEPQASDKMVAKLVELLESLR
jgi:hypothetical protein